MTTNNQTIVYAGVKWTQGDMQQQLNRMRHQARRMSEGPNISWQEFQDRVAARTLPPKATVALSKPEVPFGAQAMRAMFNA